MVRANQKTQAVDYFSATTFNKDATVAGQADLPPATSAFMINDNWAFMYSMEQGIPKLMSDNADVLYAKIPWEQGFNAFYEAANVIPQWDYKTFLEKIRSEIIRINKPTIIVCGNKALKVLRPDSTGTAILNRKEARLALWGIDDSWGRINTIDILHDLAERFSSIGDFACGYGRTGKIFTEHGKRWFMSDLNPHCIGFIKQTAKGWNTPNGNL
jgi:hypothetical protein